MNGSQDPLAKALAEQAAEWRARHREGSLDERAQQQFSAWLQASPAHVGAYLEVAALERDVREAARSWAGAFRPLEADRLGDPVVAGRFPAAALRPARRRAAFAVLAIAASLFAFTTVMVLTLRDGQRFGLPRAYETAHAEQRSWPLPDGSVLHLNSGSRVVVSFDRAERLVAIQRGQAMFRVAKDPARRFRVDAGDTQVIAIGTEFDVYRRPAGTRVVVLEGRVAVVRARSAPGGAAPAPPADAISLAAGQQIEMSSAAAPPQVTAADLRRTRAWTQRTIVLDAAPLVEVVEDFNRYSHVPIEIEGDDLKRLQISGVFGAYDVESLLEFLRRVDGVRVETTRSRVRIYAPTPADPALPQLVRDSAGGQTPAPPQR